MVELLNVESRHAGLDQRARWGRGVRPSGRVTALSCLGGSRRWHPWAGSNHRPAAGLAPAVRLTSTTTRAAPRPLSSTGKGEDSEPQQGLVSTRLRLLCVTCSAIPGSTLSSVWQVGRGQRRPAPPLGTPGHRPPELPQTRSFFLPPSPGCSRPRLEAPARGPRGYRGPGTLAGLTAAQSPRGHFSAAWPWHI